MPLDPLVMDAAAQSSPVPISAFTLTLEHDEAQVRDTLQNLTGRLRQTPLASDLVERVELALAEVLNNIVEHGTRQGGACIEVSVESQPSGLSITCVDQGDRLPDHLLRAVEGPDLSEDICDLPEGGFGWSIIHAVSDHLHYRRNGEENLLTLFFEPRPEEM